MSPPTRSAPPSTDLPETTSSRAALFDLAAIAVPPAAWFVHLNVSYLLVPPSCRAGHRWFLLAVTVAAVAVMVPSALRSLRAGQNGDEAGLEGFLGRIGVWFSALFAGATLLVGLAAAIVGPCQ